MNGFKFHGRAGQNKVSVVQSNKADYLYLPSLPCNLYLIDKHIHSTLRRRTDLELGKPEKISRFPELGKIQFHSFKLHIYNISTRSLTFYLQFIYYENQILSPRPLNPYSKARILK